MVKVLLFDFDGTVADSFENFLQIVDFISEKYSLSKIQPGEVEALRSEDAKTLVKRLKVSFYKIPFIARDMKKMQQQEILNIKPFNGLAKVLRQLKDQGIILGIITSNGKMNVDLFLKKNKIDFFDYFVGDIGLFGKGSAINKFLKRENISKDEVVYVGDEIRDIEACRKAGIKIAAVTWGFNSESGLVNNYPDFLIKHPKDLLQFV